jgi:hypothetical protein
LKFDEPLTFCLSILLLAMACHYNLLAPKTAGFFLLGMFVAGLGSTLPASIKLGLSLTGLVALFAIEDIFSFSPIQVAWCLAILSLLAGVGRAFESNPVVSVFAWFGRNSLVVLIFHAMFIVLFKPASKLFLALDGSGLLFSMVVLVFTMTGSLLVALLMDRERISQYFFGVNRIYSSLTNSDTMIRQSPLSLRR